MLENENIDSLAKELSSGNAIYALKPEDVEEKFFVGQAVIIAAATVFGTAFLKGVNSALEERGKELGKTVTNWIMDKIQGLFRKPKDAKTVEDESKKESAKLSQSASKLDKKIVDTRLEIMEKQTAAALEEQGISLKQAKEIAKKTRVLAESEISKAAEYGTK